MGQMLIRNLDDTVVAGLKARAERQRTSAEEEARRALGASVRRDPDAVIARLRATRRANGTQSGPTALELLRRDRDRDEET